MSNPEREIARPRYRGARPSGPSCRKGPSRFRGSTSRVCRQVASRRPGRLPGHSRHGARWRRPRARARFSCRRKSSVRRTWTATLPPGAIAGVSPRCRDHANRARILVLASGLRRGAPRGGCGSKSTAARMTDAAVHANRVVGSVGQPEHVVVAAVESWLLVSVPSAPAYLRMVPSGSSGGDRPIARRLVQGRRASVAGYSERAGPLAGGAQGRCRAPRVRALARQH